MNESISLREYVDVRFEAQEKAVAAALAAAKEAVVKAQTATDRRFENSNEWRNTVETLQRTYMPRTEALQLFNSLTEKVEAVQKFLWMGLGAMLAIQLFIGMVFVFLKKSL